MNKSFVFKILYYVCFVVSIIIWICASKSVNIFGIGIETTMNGILGIINSMLFIYFSIKAIKNKLEKVNILFPILYLLFSIVVVILVIIMNNKLMIQYMHFGYYVSFILFNYLLLNMYSVLLFTKTKK